MAYGMDDQGNKVSDWSEWRLGTMIGWLLHQQIESCILILVPALHTLCEHHVDSFRFARNVWPNIKSEYVTSNASSISGKSVNFSEFVSVAQ